MLTGTCIHPDLIRVLSLCGHGDKVLIADGNYPLASKSGAAEKVYLGLTPGIPSVTEVLTSLQSVINIEQAEVMQPEDGSTPPIFEEFNKLLPELALQRLDRYAFYEACGVADVKLAISTGEGRTFANLLITVGVA